MKVPCLLLSLSFIVALGQTTRFTKASKTYDVVFNSGPCSEDDKCGPVTATLYRKRAKKPFQEIVGGTVGKSHLDEPIHFADLNFDGFPDLTLNDGFRAPGGLGIEALKIYLYSATSKRFVFNSALSDLSQSEGIDLDGLDRKHRRIVTYARPGGGYFRWRGYSVVKDKPVMVSEITEDATIENGTMTLLTTKKLVNGRWRTWTKRYKGRLNQ